MSDQLCASTLGQARAAVPSYPRDDLWGGIVHLGLGAFARAHLAVYADELIARDHRDLGIVGVSLRNTDVREALGPQGGLYTLGVVRSTEITPRVIGSVLRVLHAPTEDASVRAALAAARLVTITVTEKGYCWQPATRKLDTGHPDVVHDLTHPDAPRSLIGHLVRLAADRRSSGTGGLTVLSLDNLPANGATLRSVVLEFAELLDPSLATWIAEELAFPCSMVDRLVPATDDSFRDRVEQIVGLRDAWPVRCEPFVQWVVERGWVGEMPPFATVGVTVVDDVAPWETMKLRVLNGMHTAAAHFGLRHGLETVDQVVADSRGRSLLEGVAAEVVDVLEAPPGTDPEDYVGTTLERFSNAALGHRCAQIAMDTSQKLPQRLLATVRERLARGLPIDALAEAIALWAWSTLGRDASGAPRTVHDPLAARYAEIGDAHGDDPGALAGALVGLDEVFGDLAGDDRITEPVASILASLLT